MWDGIVGSLLNDSAERSGTNNCRRHVHGSLVHGLLLEHLVDQNRCRKLMFVWF